MTGHRSDTAAPAEGFDARMEQAFAWVVENARIVFPILGGLVLLCAIGAGVWEYFRYTEAQAQDALALVDDAWVVAMGANLDSIVIPEPANREQAKKAREEALTGFNAVALEHEGTRAGRIASLRAAQMEAEVGQLEAADTRLSALVATLEPDDVLKAMSLRFQGFVREQRSEFTAAGESYAAAAEIAGYPAVAALWIAAGDAYGRDGASQQAIAAYEEALSKDPDLSERAGVIGRIDALRN